MNSTIIHLFQVLINYVALIVDFFLPRTEYCAYDAPIEEGKKYKTVLFAAETENKRCGSSGSVTVPPGFLFGASAPLRFPQSQTQESMLKRSERLRHLQQREADIKRLQQERFGQSKKLLLV